MNLKEIRELKGLSVRELADISNVAPSTIVSIEKGRSKGYPSTLKKLAAALKVSITKLTKEN